MNKYKSRKCIYLSLKQFLMYSIYIYILSVYRPFFDRVGLPLHNTSFPGGVNEEYWSSVFRPDVLPDVNHMRGMQYQIVLNIIFWPELN